MSRAEPARSHGAVCPAKPVAPRPSTFLRRVKRSAQPVCRWWRLTTGRFRVLPDFVIVGAQKAGTTSLYGYLTAQPEVLPAAAKEVHFFDTCSWDAGPAAYRANFPLKIRMWLTARARGRPVITGEATPYYLHHPLVAERLAATAPDVKVVILLRDPVERALSHYAHEVRGRREDLPVREAMLAEEGRLRGHEAALVAGEPSCRHLAHRYYSYQDRSRYSHQVARFLAAFPAEQVLVLQSEKLFQDDSETKTRLARFLGLSDLTRPFVARGIRAGRARDEADDRTRMMLREVLSEDEDALADLLGDGFRWQTCLTIERQAS